MNEQQIAKNIRAIMEERSMSQRELAELLGRSQPAIWRLLDNPCSISICDLNSIAKALRVSIKKLTSKKAR